ncbi:MAG: thioredoxin family protein [Deltaproteobacteria bacterium]|nr:thioredoxin family protein [Deltaproteobacteria bacterium]
MRLSKEVVCLAFAFDAMVTTSARADTLSDLEAPFLNAIQSGRFGLALGLTFVAGLATSLTPCVYPMIAITVSVFGAHKAKNKAEGALLSTAFVLGIAALFTPLGLFAATTGGLFGSLLSSPIVLLGLAILFLVLAASMFGAFELDLPLGLKNKLARVGGLGIKGAFLLGLVCALVAAPCTGPILGFLLTWIGTTGNILFGAVSLFAYAMGLGLLFWLVGTFSINLPKSGPWLEWVRSAFGIVMVVAAGYYLRNLIPGAFTVIERSPVFLLAALSAIAAGIALGAIHLSYRDSAIGSRYRKSVGIGLTVFGFLALIAYFEALPPGEKIEWLKDYGQAKERALEKKRPLLVEFGASWCAACGQLDRLTFSDPRVVREARRFIAVRIDLSPGSDSEQKRAILASYAHVGLPLVVLHDQTGKETARLTRFVEAETLIEIMRRVP